jgi:hypothetical protein
VLPLYRSDRVVDFAEMPLVGIRVDVGSLTSYSDGPNVTDALVPIFLLVGMLW